ncbi:MAG: ABC transporter ATP-binding protein [Chloroflexota bacterium]
MLHVQDVSLAFGKQQILDDVSFTLAKGDVGLLIGQNGTGKSTLLRCIAGWSQSESGTVTINQQTRKQNQRMYYKQFIFVPDTPDFYDSLTLWEHCQFVARMHNVADWQITSESLLQHFALQEHKDSFPFMLSRGMRYKLGITLALLVSPPLLLLDEPFGPLDAVACAWLWERLRDYAQTGKTVLLSTHTLPEGQLPDYIFHIHNKTLKLVPPEQNQSLSDLLDEN